MIILKALFLAVLPLLLYPCGGTAFAGTESPPGKKVVTYNTISPLLLSPSGKAALVGTQSPPGEITVTSNIIKKGDLELLLGVNWEFTPKIHSLREIFQHHRQEFASFLQAQGVRCLRYPGGDYGFWFFWGVPSDKWYMQYNKRIGAPGRPDDWIELPEFLKFLKEGNFRGIITLNTLQYWDPVANEVRRAKGKSGLNVHPLVEAAKGLAEFLATQKDVQYYLEIGNEDYRFYTPEEYAEIVSQVAPILKRILPDKTIIITGQSLSPAFVKSEQWLSWTDKVLRILAQKGGQAWVDFLSHHDYSIPLPVDRKISINKSVKVAISDLPPEEEWRRYMSYDPTSAAGWKSYLKEFPADSKGNIIPSQGSPISLLSELLQKYGYQNTKIWITEYRNGFMTNRYSKALAGGLGNLHLLLAYFKSPNVAGAVVHSLIHASRVSPADNWPFFLWGFNILEYAPYLPQKFIATPVLSGFSLVSRLAQGKELLETTTSDAMLSVACSQGQGHYRLLVINQDLKYARRTHLRLAAASEAFSINGQRIDFTSKGIGDYAVDYGSFDKVTPITPTESPFSAFSASILSFPPHSATLLEFTLAPK